MRCALAARLAAGRSARAQRLLLPLPCSDGYYNYCYEDDDDADDYYCYAYWDDYDYAYDYAHDYGVDCNYCDYGDGFDDPGDGCYDYCYAYFVRH